MSNTMKRTLSLLLVLVMAFSLAEPAYAVSSSVGEADLTVDTPSVQPKDEVISDGKPIPVEDPLPVGEPDPAEEPAIPEIPDEPIELPGLSEHIPELPADESMVSVDEPITIEDIELTEPEDLLPERTFNFADEDGFSVEVYAPEGALPIDAEMHVTRLTDLAPVQNAVDRAENLNGSVELAADISFTLFGKEIEPAEGSKLVVRMSAPEIEGIAAPVVIHIPDGENAVPEIVEQLRSDDLLMADTVSFEASNFSVYAVIDESEEEEESRLQINFKRPDGTVITTIYIKNGDVYWDGEGDKPEGESLINDIVYDPGLGENYVLGTNLFRGWTIDAADANPQPEATEEDPNPDPIPYGADFNEKTKVYTIDEITEYLAGKLGSIDEGDVLDIYAMIFKTFTISYFGTSTTVSMGQHIAYAPLADDATADYTIEMGYTPDDNTHYFEGWKIMSGAENIVSAVDPNGVVIAKPYVTISEEDPDAEPPVTATVFPNGSKLVVKGNIQFTVSAPAGHWLIFKENGKGATFNAPQFVKDGEVSFQPANAMPARMIRNGYTFLGWYELETTFDENGKAIPVTDANGNYTFKSNDEFVFEQPVTYETVIAAKWQARETAPYTVVIWKQSVKGGDKYDFEEAIPFTGNTGDPINIITQDGAEVLEYLQDNSARRTKNVKINGEEYAYKGFHTGHYDTGKTVAAEGNTVVNVYYDRNNIQLRFWYVTMDLQKISADDVQTSVLFGNGGTYYLKNSSGGYDEVTLRRQWVGLPIIGHWELQIYRNGSWVALEDQYHDKIYQENGQSMKLNETYNGLYGATLKEPGYAGQSYTWPDTRWWYEGYNDTTYTTWYGSTVYGFEGTGTRTTFLDSFLPTTDGTIVNVYGFDPESSSNYIIWYQEKPDGSGYVEANRVRSGSGTFYLSDKYTGFECVSWSTNGTTWNNVGQLMQSGDNWYYDAYPNQSGLQGVSYSGNLHIRFNRLKYKISYKDGAYVDGNNNPVEEDITELGFIGETDEITYGADISSYGQRYLADGTTPNPDYLIPTPNDSRFVFEGWYADETGVVPYDFDTMPLDGVTVFAKWRITQYRVFLRTNVPESDGSLDWGDDEQNMNFRVNIGEYVSAPTGIRNDYNFVGWYLDEDFNQVFDAERVPLSDDIAVDYDKTASENMTDNTTMIDKVDDQGNHYQDNKPINKWGYLDEGDPGVNKDVKRTWITRKLDLYAKWKAVLDGADGISVVYDEVPAPAGAEDLHGYGQAGTAPTDGGRLYEDNSKAIAQSASKAASADEHFLYWVVQKWNKTDNKWEDVKNDEGKLVTAYPGDNFVVLAAYAKITPNPDDASKNFYEVHLRAEYGKKDGPAPTYVTWYSNVYDVAGNEIPEAENKLSVGVTPTFVNESGATQNYTAVEFAEGKGIGFTRQDVKINNGIEIPDPETFKMEGYTFLGWGRVDVQEENTNPDGNVVPTRGASGITDPADLTEDDLFLKWIAPTRDGEGGYYQAKDNDGNWVRVSEVAADEDKPYNDLYAVWGGVFYVVYTGQDDALSEDNIQTYQITRANASFDLLATHDRAIGETGSAIHEGYLYAGYYTTAYAPDDGKAYDGTNWVFAEPQSVDGSAMQPVGGKTYYIKEVPGTVGANYDDNYLKPKLAYTFYKNGSGGFYSMGSVYLISMIDGSVKADGTGSYLETGFVIGDKKADRVSAETVHYLKIYAKDDETKYSEYTGKGENGLITYAKVFDRPVRDTKPELDLLGDNETVYQYWVTNDNFLVFGYTARAYKNVNTYNTVISLSGSVSNDNYELVNLNTTTEPETP